MHEFRTLLELVARLGKTWHFRSRGDPREWGALEPPACLAGIARAEFGNRNGYATRPKSGP